MRRISSLTRDERGATAVEYALILAMVFLAMIGAVRLFATSAIEMWDSISNEVRAANDH